jgi:hypothetical protein
MKEVITINELCCLKCSMVDGFEVPITTVSDLI